MFDRPPSRPSWLLQKMTIATAISIQNDSLFEKRSSQFEAAEIQPIIEALNTLRLWNCQMQKSSMKTLSQFRNLDTVAIDNVSFLKIGPESEPAAPPPYAALLQIPTLKFLSLRSNEIDDATVTQIAQTLASNTSLLSLTLFHNRVSDQGALKLSKALKTNGTLQSLSLARNQISDEGAGYLCRALMKHLLLPDELAIRAQLANPDQFKQAGGGGLLGLGVKEDELYSSRILSRDNLSSLSTKGGAGVSASGKKTPTPTKPSAAASTTTASASKKDDRKLTRVGTAGSASSKKLTQNQRRSSVYETDGQTWSLGNETLLNLNLGYNFLGNGSAEMFLGCLKYQKENGFQQSETMSGLTRLTLAGNAGISPENLQKIAAHFSENNQFLVAD